MIDNQPLSLQEIEKRGKEIYETQLKEKIESEKNGKYLVLEVESGEYFINDFLDEALKEAKKKFPNKIFYSLRIGYPGVFSFSSMRGDNGNCRYL